MGWLKNAFKEPIIYLEDRVYLLEREDVHEIRTSRV
jgi:hypothetical protein